MSKIVTKKVSEIKPDKNQPRKTFHEEELKFLAESILSNGQLVPIEIDQNDTITNGERRWRASKLAKIKEIDCIVVKVKDDKEKLRRQLVGDIQDEDIPTEERYKAMLKLWKFEKNFDSKLTKENFAKSLGVVPSSVASAFEYLDFAEEEPELVKGIGASLVSETRSLPKEERKEIIKALKEKEIIKTPMAIREVVKQKKQELEEKKNLEILKARNKLIEEANKYQLKVTTTQDVLNEIRDGIFSTHQELNNLMSRIKRVRRTKLYLYKAREKESFLKVVDGAIERARKWADELEDIKETIDLEIVKE